jgi:hypothetical protein
MRARPSSRPFDVLLMGSDGLAARLSGEELSGCELVYSEENAWELKTGLHPPSARVKDLAQIAVIGADLNIARLLLQDGLHTLKEEGTSRKNDRSVTVYTAQKFIPMEDLPRIDQVSARALGLLEYGERVMLIELDGLGWEMLQQANAPYINSLNPRQALACTPPDSKTGLAALLGIHNSEDIFTRASKLGKTSAYVQGSHAPVGASLRPVLSLTDEEVLANALEALAGEPDLIFVHFHGIDDTVQDHGPYSQEAMTKISEIDAHVQALIETFPGRVILTADHGLHETKDGGAHGEYSYEDMIVPYIVK